MFLSQIQLMGEIRRVKSLLASHDHVYDAEEWTESGTSSSYPGKQRTSSPWSGPSTSSMQSLP